MGVLKRFLEEEIRKYAMELGCSEEYIYETEYLYQRAIERAEEKIDAQVQNR